MGGRAGGRLRGLAQVRHWDAINSSLGFVVRAGGVSGSAVAAVAAAAAAGGGEQAGTTLGQLLQRRVSDGADRVAQIAREAIQVRGADCEGGDSGAPSWFWAAGRAGRGCGPLSAAVYFHA